MNIDNYAKTARFSFRGDERDFILRKADELMKNFDAIKKINTENITPMFTVLDVKNVLREDTAKKFDSREKILSTAAEQYGGYFQVPKAIE